MRAAVLAWALFDLANTFFAIAMLSFHFPLWLVEERGMRELWFSVALGASMACVGLMMPFCGALSDATGSRMRFVRWTTYGCAAATLLISLTSQVGVALCLFGVANLCYQLGTVFYDALLWSVAPPQRMGRISGFGAAFGYLGSALGLLLLWPFVRAGSYGAGIAPSALYFLLFALPSFLLVREQPRTPPPWRDVMRAALLRFGMTVRSARSFPGLWRYLWASLFSLSAINTTLIFMVVYVRKVLGFTHEQVMGFFLFSQLFAMGGALLLGWAMERWGARRTLMWIWLGWMAALALATVNVSGRWMWVVGPVIGFCLGSTWSTGRVLVTELSPKDQLAQMLGLAGLFARASSIIGPLLWGLIVWDPSRYRHAVVALILLLGVGAWLLRGVPDSSRVRG